jgi:hypothetical protein
MNKLVKTICFIQHSAHGPFLVQYSVRVLQCEEHLVGINSEDFIYWYTLPSGGRTLSEVPACWVWGRERLGGDFRQGILHTL